jgi:hypothetical protein
MLISDSHPCVDTTPAPGGGEALHVEHTEVQAKIALNRLELFTAQVALVNKKLARHGLPPLQVIPGRKHRHYMSDENRGVDSYVWSIDVRIVGQTYRLGAYQLVAQLSHDTTPVTVRAFGDVKLPLELLQAEATCDHCQKKRKRTTNFVLQSSDGYKLVGKSCVREYTGVSPAAALAATSIFTEFQAIIRAELEYFDPDAHSNVRLRSQIALMPFLNDVACSIRLHGWMSSTAAKDRLQADPKCGALSTAVRAWKIGNTRRQQQRERQAQSTRHPELLQWVDPLTDGDRDVARDAVEHMRAQYLADRSTPLEEFTANMAAIVEAGELDLEKKGVAAYIVQWHLTALHKEAELRLKPSEHQGVVGQAFQAQLRVLWRDEIPGQFGIAIKHRMVDPDGNQFVWFCSGANSLARDSVGRYKMRIKKHAEYEGRKETVVTHVAALIEAQSSSQTPQDLN